MSEIKRNPTLTQEKLKKSLCYNPDSGIFTRRIHSNRFKIGDIVGFKIKKGYLYILFQNKKCLAHRLAWLYVHGYWPENQIDHINRNKADNRIANLREVSPQCNMRNRPVYSKNKTKIPGVNWDKIAKKWAAQLSYRNKTRHLGSYNSFDNAVCARLAAEQCLDWSMCASDSPAYIYVKKRIQQHG